MLEAGDSALAVGLEFDDVGLKEDVEVSTDAGDVAIELETDGYEIAAAHGLPSADAATGELMHVGTLFSSPTRDGEACGGVVLVRVEE